MSILSDARAAIYALIEAAVPAAQTIFDVETGNRVSWRELVAAWESSSAGPTLQPPFCVVRWMPKVQTALGGVANECYEWPVVIYYVTTLRDTDDGSTKGVEARMAEIEDACLALTSALRAYTGAACTPLESEVDDSDTNPANDYMLAKNLPFWVGAVSTRLLVGQSA